MLYLINKDFNAVILNMFGELKLFKGLKKYNEMTQ